MTSVLIFALLLAQQVTPPEKCVLSGTAVDSITGAPLAKVEIVAQHLGGDSPGASTTTDTTGKFRIVEVDSGQYRLSAKRNGYLDTYYGARKSSARGSTITLTAGQHLEDLHVKLTPFGVIAGTVRDADGEALANHQVDLFALKYSNGVRRMQGQDQTFTNDLGEYRFANLPPGQYYLSTPAHSRDRDNSEDHSAKSDNAWEVQIRTFYPGTSDPAAASAVELAAGAKMTNADITIIRSRVYNVSVHVDTPDGTKASAALIYSVAGFDGPGGETHNDSDGNIRISGIPPGAYALEFRSVPPPKPVDGAWVMEGGGCGSATVPVVVDRGDVEGVRVAAQGCGEIGGHIAFEGGTGKEHAGFDDVRLDAATSANGTLWVGADGTFRTSVAPGQHTIDVPGEVRAQRSYVKSIKSGNQDVLRQGFAVGAAEKVELEIVLALDGGSVNGVVTDADDKPVSGAMVALIPNDPVLRARRDFTWNTVADQDGHFELKGVAPGEYKAFAWDDIEQGGWFDPEVLKNIEGKGEAVSVKPKDAEGQGSASPEVKLRVIP